MNADVLLIIVPAVMTAVMVGVMWRWPVQRCNVIETRETRIARLECATGMCEHAVNGEHPVLMRSQYGKLFWRLPSTGVMWEVGTPCPTAPIADAN